MQTRRARSRIEAQRAITDDRDKHFDKCGCRCHCLPAPAPHLQDKCASVSYVSPCSIVAIIITSQSCASSNHRASSFNSLSDSHLHYTVTHGARSTLRALAVPGRRVPSRYPIPRREACSRPGLTITRQLTIWAHWHRDLAPPLPVSGRLSFAANRPAHALTRPLRLPRSF